MSTLSPPEREGYSTATPIPPSKKDIRDSSHTQQNASREGGGGGGAQPVFWKSSARYGQYESTKLFESVATSGIHVFIQVVIADILQSVTF